MIRPSVATRLDRLESAASPAAGLLIVVVADDETPDQALARTVAELQARGFRVTPHCRAVVIDLR
ncbi:hypothetical protein BURK2_02887 [Burkholderiales bacterium]|nr:hypothetical protein BURK2_02887 [Burkholderiales bacterium]